MTTTAALRTGSRSAPSTNRRSRSLPGDRRAHRRSHRHPHKGGELDVTWKDYADKVERLAAGLAGPRPRARRHARDHAHQPARVPSRRRRGDAPRRDALLVYNTSSPEQIEYLFADAGTRIVVTEQEFLDRSSRRGTRRRARARGRGRRRRATTARSDRRRRGRRGRTSTSRPRGRRSSPTTCSR